MKIFVCSPYRGDVKNNVKNAQDYCKWVVKQGHIPFAPHLIYPQFLDDNVESERNAGIQAGKTFMLDCDAVWVFGSKMTSGMKHEVNYAQENDIEVRFFHDEELSL